MRGLRQRQGDEHERPRKESERQQQPAIAEVAVEIDEDLGGLDLLHGVVGAAGAAVGTAVAEVVGAGPIGVAPPVSP